MATKETKLPAIPPIPSNVDPQLKTYLSAVDEALKVRLGRVGDPKDRAVTVRELIDSGLAENFLEEPFNLDAGTPPNTFIPVDGVINLAVPPDVTSFSGTGTFQKIILSWDLAQFGNFAFTEVWRHTSNNLGSATRIDTTRAQVWSDTVDFNSNFYYWVRHVSTSNIVGQFAGAVNVTTSKITDANADTAIAAGAIDAAEIKAGAITTDKIAADAVTAAKIETGTITAASGVIADAAITTAKIADANVTTAKIADANITSAKIGSAAITTAKITDANITTLKIANQAVSVPATVQTAQSTATTQTNSHTFTVSSDDVSGGNTIQLVGWLTFFSVHLDTGGSHIDIKVNGTQVATFYQNSSGGVTPEINICASWSQTASTAGTYTLQFDCRANFNRTSQSTRGSIGTYFFAKR